MGQQLAEPGAGLAVLAELEDGSRDRQRALPRGHAGDALAVTDGIRKLGSLQFGERRFVIEEVDLRGCAGLVEIDDAFCLGRKVGKTGRTVCEEAGLE